MTERLPTEDRQRQIADAALRIIAERGLGRFTTSAIAKAVGITDGAIFRHFPTKEAIVMAAIGRVEEILFAEPPEPEGDALDRLGAFVRRRARAVRDVPGISRVVFGESLAKAGGKKGASRVDDMKRRSVQHVRELLKEARREGILVEDVPIDDLVAIVQGAILGMVFGPERRRSPDSIWRSLETLIRRR